MKTRVGIVGAGPAGMLLSHLLGQAGIDNVVVERQSRDHVLGRIRAGVLEWGTVETLRDAGLGTRMDAEGHVHDVTTPTPSITFSANGTSEQLTCDIVAGCDGFHGVSRHAIPNETRVEFERVYPFGWLGIMSETPPLPNLMYATHERGFALCSMRTPMLSRYYVQCSLEDDVGDSYSDMALRAAHPRRRTCVPLVFTGRARCPDGTICRATVRGPKEGTQ